MLIDFLFDFPLSTTTFFIKIRATLNTKSRQNQSYVGGRRKDLILLPRMRMSHQDWNNSMLRFKKKQKSSVINENQFLLNVNPSNSIFFLIDNHLYSEIRTLCYQWKFFHLIASLLRKLSRFRSYQLHFRRSILWYLNRSSFKQ